METVKYYVEFRLESKSDTWKRFTALSFDKLIEAESDIQDCLKRQKENGDSNYSIFKDRVLEYRVIEVNTSTREAVLSKFPVVSPKLIQYKKDELYYSKQILKYLKHLEHLYISSKIADRTKLWPIETSIANTEYQIKEITKNLEELTGVNYYKDDEEANS
jgi:hypothetical protein